MGPRRMGPIRGLVVWWIARVGPAWPCRRMAYLRGVDVRHVALVITRISWPEDANRRLAESETPAPSEEPSPASVTRGQKVVDSVVVRVVRGLVRTVRRRENFRERPWMRPTPRRSGGRGATPEREALR